MRVFTMIGAICAALSVALGAFGAHVLEGMIPSGLLETWGKGVTYQMLHSTGLLIIGILLGKFPSNKLMKWAGWIMFLGIILFSGSLYVLVLTKISSLGMITPFGGVSFVAAWILLCIAMGKLPKSQGN